MHGTRYTIRRLLHRQQTAQSRLTLLEAERHHQLLLLKELEQSLLQHQHRIQELQPEHLQSPPPLPPQALQWWEPEKVSMLQQ